MSVEETKEPDHGTASELWAVRFGGGWHARVDVEETVCGVEIPEELRAAGTVSAVDWCSESGICPGCADVVRSRSA